MILKAIFEEESLIRAYKVYGNQYFMIIQMPKNLLAF